MFGQKISSLKLQVHWCLFYNWSTRTSFLIQGFGQEERGTINRNFFENNFLLTPATWQITSVLHMIWKDSLHGCQVVLREANTGCLPMILFSASTMHSMETSQLHVHPEKTISPSSASNLASISNGVKRAATFGFEALESIEKYKDGWKHNKYNSWWFYLYSGLIWYLSSKDFCSKVIK